MTRMPNKASRPSDVMRVADRILRLLEQEEAEAEELRRLRAEGWRPPHRSRPGSADSGRAFGDGRDALADLIGSEIEHREAMLAEARRRIAARARGHQPGKRQTGRAGDARASPSTEALGDERRVAAGLLAHDPEHEQTNAGRGPDRSERFDSWIHPVKYQASPGPSFGSGPFIPGQRGPYLEGGGALGFGPGGGGGGGRAPSFSLRPILRFFGLEAASKLTQEEARRHNEDGITVPPSTTGPALPPLPIRPPSPPLTGSPPPPPEDKGRTETLPTTPPGTMYGFPGNPPEPPERPDREPEPQPSLPHAYPGVVDWIEQEGLFLQNSKGDSQTQADNNYIINLIVKGLKARGVRAEHVHGRTKSERYLGHPVTKQKGSARTDGGIRIDGSEDDNWDFNTVDTLKDRETPDARERRAGEKIKRLNEDYHRKLTYFDQLPKSRRWVQAEWRRRIAEWIERLLNERFGLPKE